MGKITLYHPLAVPYIREAFRRNNIYTKSIKQTSLSPDYTAATYDAVFTSIDDREHTIDTLSPLKVKQILQLALSVENLPVGFLAVIDRVSFTKSHWSARLIVMNVAQGVMK